MQAGDAQRVGFPEKDANLGKDRAGEASRTAASTSGGRSALCRDRRPDMLVVDPWHWLNEKGDLPTDNPRLRRQVLRVARFIEYGGPLQPMQARETLVDCRRRPGGRPCPGLRWVVKAPDEHIEAICLVCGNSEMRISNWKGTHWADGLMKPAVILPARLAPRAGGSGTLGPN
jgi:hypothetical protein